jgi:hypothetical protein
MSEVTVDFITKEPWQMVLVEEGPWDDIATNLRRVQDRLYNCIDAVIEGKLAEIYPDSLGVIVVIRLDGYDLPMPDAQEFFETFSSSVLELTDYNASLGSSPYVSGIQFEGHFQ